MARISYTSYKNSPLATVVSFLSGLIGFMGIAIGIIAIFDGDFRLALGGILIFVVGGLGGNVLAASINAAQTNAKWWKTVIRAQGWEAQLPNSVDICFQVYNANPNKWTLNKIQLFNPAGAAQIRQALASKSTSEDVKKQPGNWFANNKVVILLVAIILVLGIMLVRERTEGEPEQTKKTYLVDCAYTELDYTEMYQAEELVVVDRFAQETSTKYGKTINVYDYYLVTYRDRDGRLVGAMLRVNDDDDIYSQLNSYAEDTSMDIGSCIVDGYVRTMRNSNSQVDQYYQETFDRYRPILGENMVSLEWMLDYYAGIK